MGLEDIPSDFAEYMGITEATAQVILSITIIFAILLPAMLLTKGKSLTIYLMVFLLAECLLVGLGWMPFWILIATVAMMALAVAAIGTQAITGE